MRRIAVLLVLLAEVVFFVDLSIAGVKTIRGYASGEFAVKGLIETQTNELVNEIRNNSAQKPNMHLQIFIEGFADKTGFSAENDRIAKERADGIAAILSREFPKAKIDFVSRGDEINKREVTVRWKYVPIPVATAPVSPETKASAKKFFSIRMWVIGIVIIILTVGTLEFWFNRKIANKMPKITESQLGKQWFNVPVNNEGIFKVEVEVNKDRKFVSPFQTKNGFPITRDTVKAMVNSLRGCLAKDEFLEQKKELIQKGLIKRL